MAFEVGAIQGVMYLDTDPFMAGLEMARREATAFVNQMPGARLTLDLAYFDAQLADAVAKLRTVGTDNPVRITADDRPLVATVLEAQTAIDAWAKQLASARLGATTVPFWADFGALRTEVADTPITVPVDAQVQNLASVAAQLGALQTMPPWATAMRGNLGWDPGVSRWRQISGTTGGQFATTGQLAALLADVGAGGAGNGADLPPEALAALMGGGGGAGGGLGALGALGAGGGGGGGAGPLQGAWNAMSFFHLAHLFTPEIIGLAAAIGSVAAGFVVLGVASIGAATDIMAGFKAVSTAQNAIAAAIPGTTQWTSAVVKLGTAWSTIPAALQPAVSSINKMMQGFGNTPMAKEIQGFLGAQAGTIASMFAHGGSTFAPLILATQRAIQTVEGMFQKMMGSGAMAGLVHSLSLMVGPALVELVQLGTALLRIGVGFAKAIQGGEGMQTLVDIFRLLANIANSSLFQGFIAGWTDFDRILAEVVGGVFKLAGMLSSLDPGLKGIGTALGFVASGYLAFRAAVYLLGKTGLADMTALYTKTGQYMKLLGGFALAGAGLAGLVTDISRLLHVSDPLASAFHAVATWLGFASKAGSTLNQTINGYTISLSAPIKITGQLSQAMTLLVRSEQSVGSSLQAAATGFATFTAKAVQSVTKMVANLKHQNTTIAAWAVDAQKLIKRGMTPSAVASLAQQAPQDLASMATATTTQLGQMSIQWQEKLLEAKMSGQNGIQGMITAIETGLRSGTPAVKAAARALATQLGAELKVPFTGTVASVAQIGAALNTLPTSVLRTLAGQTQNASSALTQLGGQAKKASSQTQSLAQTIFSLITNAAMTVGGLAMLRSGFSSSGAGMASAVLDVNDFDAALERLGLTADAVDLQVGAMAATATDTAGAFTAATAAASEDAGAMGASFAADAGGFASVLGPVGLLAGGAVVVGGLIAAFTHLGDSGVTVQKVTQAVTQFGQKLGALPTTSVLKIKSDLITLDAELGSFEVKLRTLTPGTTAFAIMATKITLVRQKMLALATDVATRSANVRMLARAFHMLAATVVQFAGTAGVTLNRALTVAKMRLFRQSVEETGTAAQQAGAKAMHAAATWTFAARQEVIGNRLANATLVASMRTAMESRLALAVQTGPRALAALANVTKGGLPAIEAADKHWGVDIPAKYLSVLKAAMEATGKVSVTKLALGIESMFPTLHQMWHRAASIPTEQQTAARRAASQLGVAEVTALAKSLASGQAGLSLRTQQVILGSLTSAKTLGVRQAQLIGAALAGGISAGLYAHSATVAATTAQLIRNAQTLAAHSAGIRSPSTVWAATIGLPLAQGIAVGLLSGTPTVAAAVTAVIVRAAQRLRAHRAMFAAAAATAVQGIGGVMPGANFTTGATANLATSAAKATTAITNLATTAVAGLNKVLENLSSVIDSNLAAYKQLDSQIRQTGVWLSNLDSNVANASAALAAFGRTPTVGPMVTIQAPVVTVHAAASSAAELHGLVHSAVSQGISSAVETLTAMLGAR